MAPQETRAHELVSSSKSDLQTKLQELKQELLNLRVAKITGGNSSKLVKIAGVRRSIARVLTVINSKQRQSLREFYKKKAFLPLDLRPKKTRAIQKRLTKHEANLVSEKQRKRQVHFPKRAYAIKA